MKYLCLVYVDEKKLAAMSPTESQALDDESLGYDHTLKKSGHFLAAQALEPVKKAATLRVRAGKLSITDGPFSESKEQVGGFILIDARDWTEALEIASKIPAAGLGGIEVRAIKELKASGE
jgi:hypothetical protein